jgi:hypothetical protein
VARKPNICFTRKSKEGKQNVETGDFSEAYEFFFSPSADHTQKLESAYFNFFRRIAVQIAGCN